MNEYIRLMKKSENARKKAIACQDVDLKLFYLNVSKGFEEKARALQVRDLY